MELQPAGGGKVTFVFTDRCTLDPASSQIDLLALTGGASDLILDNEAVPSGRYNWMRLLVNARQNVRDSCIVINGQEFELRIPSGDESGLKLNRGFIVPAVGTLISGSPAGSPWRPSGRLFFAFVMRGRMRLWRYAAECCRTEAG